MSDKSWEPGMSECSEQLLTQEADGLVYAYFFILVAKNFGGSATGFEGVFLDFYIYISQKYGPGPKKIGETRLENAIYD